MKEGEDHVRFVEKLQAESALWVREGLIAPGQRDRILAYNRTAVERHSKAGSGRLIATISVMGSILVGLGLILFVASNWHAIPKSGKLILLFSIMFGAYGAGYYMGYLKERFPKVGSALILLGTISYGANIYLIAQIYNISVHYPNGELLWVAGTLPLAYLLRSRTILMLALINLLIWCGMEAGFWLRETERYGFVVAYLPLYLMAGLVLNAVGIAHRSSERASFFAAPYLWLGTTVAMTGLFLLTFSDMLHWNFGAVSLTVFYLPMAVIIAGGLGIALIRGRNSVPWLLPEIASLILLAAATLALIYLNPAVRELGLYGSHLNNDAVTVLTLASNCMFGLAVIGMLLTGFARKSAFHVNAGLLFFVLDVVARYFDFFWKMLPRSLFFMAGGIMLIAGSLLLERKRRRLLASFDPKETPE